MIGPVGQRKGTPAGPGRERSRVLLAIAAVTLVINAVAFPFLPDQVGIQFGLGGFTNYAPKALFLVLMPAVLLLVGATARRSDTMIIVIGFFLAAINVVTIIINLAWQ